MREDGRAEAEFREARQAMDPDDKIPTRQDALRKIASSTAGLIGAGGWADMFGYDVDDDWTDAERGRMEWALEEVKRRLYAMGEPRGRRRRKRTF